MPFDTFTPQYAPSAGPTNIAAKPRVLRAQFGDGYEQISPDGINPLRKTAQLGWSHVSIATANAMMSFWDAHIGVPFYYTLPGEGVPRKWEAVDWERDFRDGLIGSVSVALRESFEPD